MSVWVRPSRYFAFSASLPKLRQQLGAAVGDVDRTAQAELGLIEQEREGVLGHHGIFVRPAQNALADRHRVDAEFAERGLLQFAIGRMIFDPLRRRGRSGRAGAAPARGGRPAARIRRDGRRRARRAGRDAARYGGTARRADGCAADRSAPDRRDRNSCRRYRARAIPAGRRQPACTIVVLELAAAFCHSCSFRRPLLHAIDHSPDRAGGQAVNEHHRRIPHG